MKRPSLLSCALILTWGGYASYCVIQSYLSGPSTTFLQSHIRGGVTDFHAGDSITVDAISTRYQTCDLDVYRYIRRVDNKSIMGDQEHQVDHVRQSFPGNGKPLATFYYIDLPNRLPLGAHELYYETEHIPFTVVPLA